MPRHTVLSVCPLRPDAPVMMRAVPAPRPKHQWPPAAARTAWLEGNWPDAIAQKLIFHYIRPFADRRTLPS